jgi:sulfofructose kinase
MARGAPEEDRVDVVGVGLNATDTIIRLPHFPEFDSKIELISADVRAGGQVASAMVACRRWGLSARYVGKVGVEAHLLPVTDCTSQIAFILVDETSGERTIMWKRDPRLEIQPEELRPEWIVNARLLLVDGHDTAAATQAARWARAAGIPVVADLDNVYPGVKQLLEVVDYPITSGEFPSRFIGKTEILKAIREISGRFKFRLMGVTLGRQGAVAWDGHDFLYSPGYQVSAMDTTGAGDIFHGAFAYGLLQDWPPQRIMDFSCAAAALNCTALGARGHIAAMREIEEMMITGARSDRAFDAEELRAQGAPR